MNNSSTLSSVACTLELAQQDIHDLYGFFVFLAVIMSLLAPLTVLLNALVIVGIYKTPSLHCPSNILLCGLAVTDLGAGAVAMPGLVLGSIAKAINHRVFWCNMKLITEVIVPPFSGVSFVTMTLVSLDRMLALQFHMRYSSMVSICGYATALIIFWIAGFIISSSFFWYPEVMDWSAVFVFALCLAICSINNAIVFRILHRHRVDIQRQQQQVQINQSTDNVNMAQRRKTSNTMLWVYLVFLHCYLPFLGVRILRNFKGKSSKTLYVAYQVPYTLMYMNSLLNPVLYCAKMRPIRRSMFSLIPENIRSLLRLRIPQ